MNRGFESESAICRVMERRLSDYTDGTLSARETWEVEKHLTACPDCSAAAQQMRNTVELLRVSTPFQTSDDFMAKLHARLDDLDAAPRRNRTPIDAMRDWLAGAGEMFRARRAPVLSLGMALAGFAALALFAQPLWTRPDETPASHTATLPNLQVQQTLERQVAASAGDPLGDAAAERLTAHAALGEDPSGGSLD